MFTNTSGTTIPLYSIAKAGLASWLKNAPAAHAAWVEASGFEAKPGSHLLVRAGRARRK